MESALNDDEVDYLTCDLCNVKIRTDTMYKIHLTTNQHRKKEDALIATGKARREWALPNWTGYLDYLDYLQLEEPIIGLNHLLEVGPQPGSVFTRFLCKLCRYEADVPDMTNHIVGRKHRQKHLETRRRDLVTWDLVKVSQLGKVVRAKAEVAERQDGRGVPQELKKKPEAKVKMAALKVPSMQKKWKRAENQVKSLDQQQAGPLHLQVTAHLRDGPSGSYTREVSHGRGFPGPAFPESLDPGEVWRAPRVMGRSPEREGGYYPHDQTLEVPVNRYGDQMFPERSKYDQGVGGGVYEEGGRRGGGVYEGELRIGGVYGGRGGVPEEEGRGDGVYEGRGVAYEEGRGGVYEGRGLVYGGRGGVSEEEGREDGAYERRGVAYEEGRGGVYEGRGGVSGGRGGDSEEEERAGGVYGYGESGRDESASYSRVFPETQRPDSHALTAEGAQWPLGAPAWSGSVQRGTEGVNSMKELPESFKRFLSGAAAKRGTSSTARVSRFSDDTRPVPLPGLSSVRPHQEMTSFGEMDLEPSKRLKLDPYAPVKEEYPGKEARSSDVLDILKHIDIESVDEANFFKDKLCNLLKEFQASKAERDGAVRKTPSHSYKEYNHMSLQQQGPDGNSRDSHLKDPFRDPQDHYERDQRDQQDNYKMGQMDPQDHYERGKGDSLDRYERGQRDPQDQYERGLRDPQDQYERGQRDLQDQYERGKRDPQDHYERGQRDLQDQYERGQRDPQDQYERGKRDPQDHYERGQRDLQDQYERGQRDPQDQYERGKRDPQDHYERGKRDSLDRYERGQRDPQGHYDEIPTRSRDRYQHSSGSRERLEAGLVDPRVSHRDSYEDVFGKTAPDPKARSVRHSGRPYPESSSQPVDAWLPHQQLERSRPLPEFDPPLLPSGAGEPGYGPKEDGGHGNSATLDKITSTLLQLVARRRPF